jgi:hypothetical protein
MALSEFIGLCEHLMQYHNVTSSSATKSQKEVTLGDLKLEKEHFKYHREVELAQVSTAISALTLSAY